MLGFARSLILGVSAFRESVRHDHGDFHCYYHNRGGCSGGGRCKREGRTRIRTGELNRIMERRLKVVMMVKKDVGVGSGGSGGRSGGGSVGMKTGSGQGFGSVGSRGSNDGNGTGKESRKKRGRKKVVGRTRVKKDGRDIQVEEGTVDGTQQTPHRAFVGTGEEERLREVYSGVDKVRRRGRVGGVGGTVVFDREEDKVVGDVEKVAVEGRKRLRWDWEMGADERLEALWKAWTEMDGGEELYETEFDRLVSANRDLVGFPLLYRMTSKILKMESEQGEYGSKVGKKWRELRRRIVDVEWDFDTRARADQQAAEKVVQIALSQKRDFSREVLGFIEGNSGRANAIWITVYAAIAAWEDRKEEKKMVKQEVFDQLMEAAKVLNESTPVQAALSPVLLAVQKVLTAPDQERQAEAVNDFDDDAVEELGIFIEQIRLYPATQYKSIHKRLIDILEFVKRDKYGVEEVLDPVDFMPKPFERNTPLARFQWSQAVEEVRMR